VIGMSRFTPFAFVLLALLLLPSVASAKYDVRVGVGDQNIQMFDQPLFQDAEIKRVRYFVPWDITRHKSQLRAAEAYVRRAREDGIDVTVHISTNDLRIKRGHLPSKRGYKRLVRRIIKDLRPLGVREWGVWNEANHPSQPTWNHPKRAAQYYKVMRKICRGCKIVALDVLDQRNVEAYISAFYHALPKRLRRKARIVGIHNYGDVNRHRSRGTRQIMRRVRKYVHSPNFWLTETGGIVKLGRTFHCSQRRAAHRLDYLFDLLKKYHRQIDRAYVYNWFGVDCDTRMDTGIVNADGTARPSYRTLRHNLRRFKR
jgi:hypothetical protein